MYVLFSLYYIVKVFLVILYNNIVELALNKEGEYCDNAVECAEGLQCVQNSKFAGPGTCRKKQGTFTIIISIVLMNIILCKK